MANPVQTTNDPESNQILAADLLAADESAHYASLTDALEQTVFESFDDGLYIGMMSGTSLDGMDAVLCQFAADMSHKGQTQQPMRFGNFPAPDPIPTGQNYWAWGLSRAPIRVRSGPRSGVGPRDPVQEAKPLTPAGQDFLKTDPEKIVF